jgi:hypothetical protein
MYAKGDLEIINKRGERVVTLVGWNKIIHIGKVDEINQLISDLEEIRKKV